MLLDFVVGDGFEIVSDGLGGPLAGKGRDDRPLLQQHLGLGGAGESNPDPLAY